jgi:hypothetical protein
MSQNQKVVQGIAAAGSLLIAAFAIVVCLLVLAVVVYVFT